MPGPNRSRNHFAYRETLTAVSSINLELSRRSTFEPYRDHIHVSYVSTFRLRGERSKSSQHNSRAVSSSGFAEPRLLHGMALLGRSHTNETRRASLIPWRKPDSNRRRLSGEVVPTFRQPFSPYIEPAATHFWALANGFFQRGPNQAPKKVGCTRTTSEVRGRETPLFYQFSSGLLAFSQVSRTSADVPGSLWSWDGWPPKSRAKCLIIKAFCYSLCKSGPNHGPSNRWLLLDGSE
jgi:hypothetical protein